MNRPQTRKQLHHYLDRVNSIVLVSSPEGTVTYVNKYGCALLELKRNQVIGMDSCVTLLPEKDLQSVKTLPHKLLNGNAGSSEFWENSMTTESGRQIAISWQNTVLYDENKNVREIISCGREQSQWKQLEDELRISERRFNIIAGFSYDWEEWIRPDMHLEYVSPSCERITGYSVAEFLQHPCLTETIVHPEDRQSYVEHQKIEVNKNREKANLSFRIIRNDGEIRWIRHQCQPVFAKDGTWLGRRATNRDITTFKETEIDLLHQQQLFQSGPIIIFKWRAEEGWPVEYVSQNIREIFGYKPQDLLSGKVPFVLLIHPDDQSRIAEEVKMYSQSGRESFDQEYRLIDAQGTIRQVYDKTNIIRSSSGRITHFHGYLLDITEQHKVDSAVRQSETRLKLALNMARLGYWHWTRDDDSLCLSEELHTILGHSPDFFHNSRKNMLKVVHPEDRSKLLDFLRKTSNKGESNSIEFRGWHAQGQQIILRAKYEDLFDKDGNHTGRQGVCQDITTIKQIENKLLISNQIFRHTLEGIIVTNCEGAIQLVNSAASKITGYNPSELIGKKTGILKSNRHFPEFYQKMWDALLSQGFWQGEIWNKRKNGVIYPLWLSITSVKDKYGNITKFIALFHDITENKEQEMMIHFQANHDALTGLPNRTLLLEHLGLSLDNARRTGKKLAVLFVDLDNFQHINDSLGHTIGDLLLQQAARRIRDCIGEKDTVARHGGDEFIIILNNLNDSEIMLNAAHKINTSFHTPFSIEGHELFVTASIGISRFPEDGESQEVLVSNADLAMYRAKKKGKNRFNVFSGELTEQVSRHLTLSNQLHRALENNEFVVYYQPKVSLEKQKTIGMEALIRWQPDAQTVISPAEFIPLAEQTGLIVPIGKFVLETACRQAMHWKEQGFSATIAVNLSPVQFQQKNFTQCIESILRMSGLPPSLLELEITESLMMENESIAIDILWKIKNMGITVSVDDFGTGYSSLAYLKKLPIDILKIDRSFVRDIPENKDDAVITSTIISMAKHLGLAVIAEGVETIEQCRFLKENGCTVIQGYLVSQPQPAAACTELLKTSWKDIMSKI